jgi:hypothetical protein
MSLRKTFCILTALISLASSGNSSSSQNKSEQQYSEESIVLPKNASVPTEALTFDVNAMMMNFSKAQAEKIHEAAKLIKKVIASPEFKSRVLNFKYNGRKQFVDNGGLTNEQIYKKILLASEEMLPLGNNNVMDLELELYTDHEANTIGYTYPDIVRVYMNTKYFNRFLPHQVADNMIHEWLHKLGFEHAVEPTPSRSSSVPYAIGYLVKELAQEL